MKKILLFVIFVVVFGGAVGVYILRPNMESELDTSNQTAKETPQEVVLPEWYETDKDGDGILDEQEAEMGTDLYASDTDGDGISDNVEIEQYGTDPTNPDTDGDGYWDGIEILSGYNPNGEGSL